MGAIEQIEPGQPGDKLLILLPRKNYDDIKDIPAEYLAQVDIRPIDTIADVVNLALLPKETASPITPPSLKFSGHNVVPMETSRLRLQG